MSLVGQPHVPSPEACEKCVVGRRAQLERLGLQLDRWDHVIALAGNPNTGKSTLFNALTGLHQRTGNWPGKTISRAEGGYSSGGKRYKLVDLPGTYSLLSTSSDEEVARDFILFGQPDVTVVVVDATALERNLNLALQILQITDRVVIAVNLMDEAKAHGIEIDARGMARDLKVPVVPISARKGEGLDQLLRTLAEVAQDENLPTPYRLALDSPEIRSVVDEATEAVAKHLPDVGPSRWVALRLLEGDAQISESVRLGELGLQEMRPGIEDAAEAGHPVEMQRRVENGMQLLHTIEQLRWRLPADFHDRLVETIYGESARVADRNSRREGQSRRLRWEQLLDRILTGRWTGIPAMALLFAAVLWITILGANVPSGMLAWLLLDQTHPLLKGFSSWLGLPFWLDGLLIDGVYLTAAWVVSVMLPPMAIFFPLFTLLEDFGYLPRVAFNLDRFFQKAGAHGKQSLTLAMGYGCNAAGVIAARIIDSPRERLIAILTNNFALCNGRWPTQILVATLFLGALVTPALAGVVAAGAVFGVAALGVVLSFAVSWALSHSLLKGEASSFSIELPPYRPPNVLRTLYTSLIDRTIFVLWRAVVFAVPAGVVIWTLANIHVAGASVAEWLVQWLEGPGWVLGLSGVILLAYIIAIPANEIVIPTVLMLTVLVTGQHELGQGAGVMFESSDDSVLKQILVSGGWTPLTAVCLMLFSLCHNPCSTTLYTIYRETGSWRWTLWSAAIPTAIGIVLCASVAGVWRLVV